MGLLRLGIDAGAQNTKVALLDGEKMLSLVSVATGFDQLASAREAVALAADKAGLEPEKVEKITGTGVGRKALTGLASSQVNEVAAAARGARLCRASVRTVIDVGAEEVRAVRLDAEGKIRDFAINEKCAAGSGSFVESMAEALQTPLEELARISLQSTRKIPMNAQCAIFAESEVISLIHSGTDRADISRAIHEAIADRVAAVARRVGLENDVVLIGGMARNPGFVDALRRALGAEISVPPDPEFVSAIGAALSEQVGG